MTDITIIIGAVIALVVAILTVVAVPYIRAKTTAEQRESIRAWVSIAVRAAEQVVGAGRGAEKKARVLEFLREHGITFDASAVDAMIEAAVRELGAIKSR